MEPIATASQCHFLWGIELEYLNRESLFNGEIQMWWCFGVAILVGITAVYVSSGNHNL